MVERCIFICERIGGVQTEREARERGTTERYLMLGEDQIRKRETTQVFFLGWDWIGWVWLEEQIYGDGPGDGFFPHFSKRTHSFVLWSHVVAFLQESTENEDWVLIVGEEQKPSPIVLRFCFPKLQMRTGCGSRAFAVPDRMAAIVSTARANNKRLAKAQTHQRDVSFVFC